MQFDLVTATYSSQGSAVYSAMFRGFNGEYRRRPAVSIGGASANKKETKEQFVKRVQEERKRRQVERTFLSFNFG